MSVCVRVCMYVCMCACRESTHIHSDTTIFDTPSQSVTHLNARTYHGHSADTTYQCK